MKGSHCFLQRETTFMAQYWLVSGMDLSEISQLKLYTLVYNNTEGHSLIGIYVN